MGEKINKFIKYIYRGILEIIYPRNNKCIICKENEAEGLCIKCKKTITFCEKDDLCIGYYKGALKELILRFKYHKDFEAGEILIELIEPKLNKISREYYLTFIPIGKKSLELRGYNQCEYIAKELGFRNGFKVIDTLEKSRETQVQKTLHKSERLKNIKGAFKVKDSEVIKNKKFIVIDDVLTTGATLNEAYRVLKESGAKEIKMLTLSKSHI
ncbi:MAG: ComF family protein [Clostridiaceae bacterium]|nr:ComF family protein [Clostridiaceae bacterium]